MNTKIEINENTITSTLPKVLDKFLMDCAQMWCNFDYTDISKFAERATKEELKALNAIRLDLKDGFDEDDPEVKDIFHEVERIVKGNKETEVAEAITESVLMETGNDLTEEQKKYVEDMFAKDKKFYGFPRYDMEDDFVEDVTIDFEEEEAINDLKYVQSWIEDKRDLLLGFKV